jgi:hypothetical protein
MNAFRLNVASIAFVGAKLKSFPKNRLSFAPPSPLSIVLWPAHRKRPSPPCVAEFHATTFRELCSNISRSAESCPLR